MSKKAKPKSITPAFFGMVLGMAISLALQLYLIPYLPFIISTYWEYLPVGVTTTILGSFLEFLGHTTPLAPMKFIFKIARHAVSIFGLYYLIRIFPFDFGLISMDYLNPILQFAFYIAIFGVGVAILADLIRLLSSIINPQDAK